MNKLKELRKENLLTQLELANYLKIKQNSYSQYENELRDIPTIVLKQLSKYYNVSIDYLLCLTDIKNIYPPSKIININTDMNRLKDIREENDLLQKDIALKLNTKQNTYSTYETGLCDISTNILKKLALFYNVPIDYLLYITDNRTPHKRNKQE